MSNGSYDKEYSFEEVSNESRQGYLSMFALMLGFTFFSGSMLAGGSLGLGLRLKEFIITVVLGNLILGVYTGLLAYISSGTGLSTHLLAKYSFGEKGSYLVSFLLGITQLGWFGVGVAMFAIPVNKITGINLYLLILIAGIAMTSTAYYGIKSATILSIIAVPSVALLGGFSGIKATALVGGFQGLMAIQPKDSMTIGAGIAICIGSFISGGTATPDYVRYAKNRRVGVITTVVAFFIGNSLMFIFGAVGAMTTGLADISEVMFLQGLAIPGIIILGFNIWTTNDNAIYTAGLGFSNITKIPKKKLVLVSGVIGTIGAMYIYNNFVNWLNLLGIFIPSIGGIIIADYFIVRKRKYERIEEAKFNSVDLSAIISWIAGVLVAEFLPGVASLNAVLASLICHIIIKKIMSRREIEKEEMKIGA